MLHRMSILLNLAAINLAGRHCDLEMALGGDLRGYERPIECGRWGVFAAEAG